MRIVDFITKHRSCVHTFSGLLYYSGSQTVVRVPVVVREGFSGGTKAAFWSNSKFYASLLLQVAQSTNLFARIYSSVIQILLIRLCAKVILSTVHLSNYILLKPGGTFQHEKTPGGTFQHKKTPGGTRSQKV